MSSTSIEKKSLEAHVELCAERYAALDKSYKTLDTKIENLSGKVEKMDSNIIAVREGLASVGEKQSRQLITIGVAIVGVLISGIIALIIHLN